MSNINNETSEKTKEELALDELENALPNFCSIKHNMAKTLEESRKKFISNGPSKESLSYFK